MTGWHLTEQERLGSSDQHRTGLADTTRRIDVPLFRPEERKLKRFRNILIAATPGTIHDDLLLGVGKLAAANQASLTILDVLEPPPAWRRITRAEGTVATAERIIAREREDRLHNHAQRTRAANAEVQVTSGKPFVEVIRHVLANGCDLVVVGEPPASGTHPASVSASVMHLVRKCPVPVWVMRDKQATPARVLALVDPDSDDPIRDGLNDLVLELATSMAAIQDAELHVAHVWDLPEAYLPLGSVDLGRFMSDVAADHRERLDTLVDRHGLAAASERVHLIKGEPGLILPGLAARLGIALMVMGTVARTGLSGLIIGNTAETILRSVDCSVLALKPNGFVSPVQLDDRQTKDAR